MKTLFLDYDGVLHPGEVYLVRGKGVVLRNEGHTLFEYADALADALEAHKDVQIVLSTSWVAMLDFKRAKKRLPTRLQDRIKGATWHSSFDRGYWQQLTRFQQIYQYANRHNLSDWLALDDDDEGWPEHKRHHLIHTDEQLGLGDESALIDLKNRLERWVQT